MSSREQATDNREKVIEKGKVMGNQKSVFVFPTSYSLLNLQLPQQLRQSIWIFEIQIANQSF